MKKFSSMAEFAQYWATRVEAAKQAQATGLRDAAETIQETTRDNLGHYLPAAGPFPEWPELSERTQEQRQELGYTPNDPLLRTGELRDSIGISYGANKAVVGVENRQVGDGSRENPTRDIGAVAVDLEMGTERIPPRSFLGSTAYSHAGEAAKIVGRAVADALAGVPYVHPTERSGGPPSADSDIPF